MKYKSFTEMPVWQRAMKFSVKIHKHSSIFPRSEDYGLTSQIRRSSNSISVNISETFGRNTPADKARFYIYVKGSAYETQNHLIYSNKVEYLDKSITNDLKSEYENLIFDLNKIIKTLDNMS